MNTKSHFNITSRRDTSQFCAGQGATTQVYDIYIKEERRSIRAKLAVSLRVLAIFFPRFVAPCHGRISTISASRLAHERKSLRTRLGIILK
ncbi:hypothetical protein A3C91_04440 [Candidatus Azambacteria bacterium RIFCSPHIGHO2_02_FULL_52_12]|uniref:Uncharacterized protein n=1 Tax=Candidatus Azambacteria bacterium RIFCSPLOWO2_01_FULL_46_25 TaxID=1797298 RepID=A0A1F5BTV9_9BACT|nr:MAG: hypothetical protein A3C91_04440 [Candidatus Azambacteria bacterium RIFCSPHIGHO2_02_FULL_52_12]OGD34051.1 MAG: hypothetical protein A2988_01020 [Candidatus Azambacteria bacterium RIFCSPLOWO2_01_FULL_46_25]OGD37620.1 MAG: hypothetical protein A2850_03650 [Candidatus Azambacteria bacterium RIFCSPHIGHO2_01_FULL_51_74]